MVNHGILFNRSKAMREFCVRVLFAVLCVVCWGNAITTGQLPAAEKLWQAGFAKVVITPT